MPLFPPLLLPSPLPHDMIDDAVGENRILLIALTSSINTLETDQAALASRISALEAKPVPPPVVTIIDIPNALYSKLAASPVGGAVILRSTTGDITLVRQ